PAASAADPTTPAGPPAQSALDATLFYQLLLGELSARGDEPATGYNLILDAARKTGDAQLYQRAVEIAFQARSGDAALKAAQAWHQAHPSSREANNYVLRILIALNRVAETGEPLHNEVALTDAADRPAMLGLVPRFYSRVADKKQAAAVVEQALAEYLAQPDTGAAAWTAVGRMRLAAGDAPAALEAARKAQAVQPGAEAPALLALELLDAKQPAAEALFKRYLEGKPLPELRMAYARSLIDLSRYKDAAAQLEVVTREKPDLPEAWLALGTLQAQDNRDADAERTFKRYVELAQAQKKGEDRNRGLAQAYLSLSRLAEKRKDYALASAWLDKIEDPQDLIAAQQRRASILARQGKLEEGRKLIRAIPEREEGDARLKLLAEVQLLRDAKQYKTAYELLGQAAEKPPLDPDLVYEQAMLAERMGKLDDMEKLLRRVIAAKPDYHQAYNALGYSLAEHNVRLTEARALVQKALSFAPDDPFIADSLGWVEFRLGNKPEAARILQQAYKSRPDPEIAAHLGEVLWSLGDKDGAQAIFKEGLILGADNETLQETIKRLRAGQKP
ncbi:tetratricopeptide repeat protein, partial [Ramlibacter aquaticus]